jgi:membrane protein
MKFTKRYLKKLIKIIKKPEMMILPGNIAFFMVLSIFPIITLFGFFSSMFNVSLNNVLDMMNQILPEQVYNLLFPYISGSGMDLHIGFSLFLGYIFASNGANSIIVCSNTLYGVPHSNYFKRRIKALFLTIILVILFVFTLFVLAFGNSILKFILSLNVLGSVGHSIYYLFLLLKWPIAIIFMFIMFKFIFTLSPDISVKSSNTNKGAFFTSVLWLISTFIYSYYVQHFSNYDIFYGSLANIIIMMIWVYILAFTLVIGIAINTQNYKDDTKDKSN